MNRFSILLLLISFLSCNNEPQKKVEQLPKTPEATARLWQKYVDTDQFEKAYPISTPRAQEWLQMIEIFLQGLPPEETAEVVNTVFREMSCSEKGNIAKCGYIIEEEGELIRDTFILHKVNNQWKVDIPEEATEESEIDIQEMIDSLLSE